MMKYNDYKRYFLILLPILIILPVCAQKVYTLDECRSMALQNNVKVRNAANTVEIARQEQKEAFTNYFPNVSVIGMGYNANKGLLQMKMAPNMRMSLLKNGLVGGITLMQPVFSGRQIVNGNRLAAEGVEVSKVQQEQSENEVRLTVEQYYWQVVILQEKLNTLRAVEAQLERINKDVEVAVGAGVTMRNDLLQVRLKRNDVASSRINLENNLSICRMMLAQYIGMDADTINVESRISPDKIPDFPYQLFNTPESALPLTIGYRLQESNVKANKLQQRMVMGKNFMQVAVGASYLYDNFMDKSHSFALGFVSISVPLSGWWSGSYSIKKQKLQVSNAENQFSDMSQLLIIAMQKAWNGLQDAYRQILIAHNSIEQSTENLRLNEDYYRAGTTTMSDLLDAQTIYQRSRDKYVETYAQFQVEIVKYLQSTGR